MSNATNDDERDLELIHPEIVDETEPWPSQGPFGWPPNVWPLPPPPPPAPAKPNWRLHIFLFVATCFTTLFAGMSDPDNIRSTWLATFGMGLFYAVPVMTILLCHEMGHYLQSRRYGVYASPPYFIPMPLPPLGTMGAVIVMKSQITNRRALFDIGISGPLAGLVPTFIFLIVGLHLSHYATASHSLFAIGSPWLFDFLAGLICGPRPENTGLIIHPMAFAGWVGLLVTSLNLIPIGQLDGGHVLYAILRKRAHGVAMFLLFAAFFMATLNLQRYGGWMLLLVLLLIMGPRHPPTADDEEPLGLWRIVLGWLTLAFILVGFTPTPFG